MTRFHDPAIGALADVARRLDATMSDVPPAVPPPTPPPAAAPPAPAPAPATPPPPAAEPDPFDNAELQQFPRDYVRKLRDSEASHRTKAKEAEEKLKAFEPFAALAPDDVGALAGFAAAVIDNPAQAAEIAKAWATELTPAEARAAAAAVGNDPTTPLTRDDVLTLLREERQAASLETAKSEIEAQGAALGFPPGTPGYVALLWEARNNHGNDLAKAAAAMKAADEAKAQQAIADYVAGKKTLAAGPAPAPGGGGPGPNTPAVPKTLAEARKSAMARMESEFRGAVGE